MRIKEVYLLSNDLQQTESFYHDILGLSVVRKEKNNLAFSLGASTLIFQHSELAKPYYHLAFDIPNNQLKEAYEALNKKVRILPVTSESQFAHFESWNAKSFYFYDNNGNLLELIARYDLSNASAQTFDPSSLLAISEIGLVTENVTRSIEQLTEQFDLPLFAKQTPQENFAALGDEQGLLILVSPERNWFPTDKKAKVFPTHVLLEDQGKVHEISLN
ncbi:hypothetical protein AAG747_10385 [Rapidithrix thailandica]|uniref:VOC domain-containing protein n=1 Tax=Rapidithrix thailandica TaxID=413964 RepID=A0AAW9SC64_9BACT